MERSPDLSLELLLRNFHCFEEAEFVFVKRSIWPFPSRLKSFEDQSVTPTADHRYLVAVLFFCKLHSSIVGVVTFVEAEFIRGWT